MLGGPKEEEARRVLRKVTNASLKVVFALTNQKRVQAVILPLTKAEARTEKERAKKVLILNLDVQPRKTPVKQDMAMPGNQTIGLAAIGLTIPQVQLLGSLAHTAWMASVPMNLANHPTHVVLDLGCTRSIGSRAVFRRFQKHALYYGITTELCSCNKSSVIANSETETCLESCIIHFPTAPPCSTRVDVLETGNVPILFSLPQMKNLGTTIELDPKRRQNYMSSFWLVLFSSRILHNGHTMLDLTPEETCNFCFIAAKISTSSSHTRTGRR